MCGVSCMYCYYYYCYWVLTNVWCPTTNCPSVFFINGCTLLCIIIISLVAHCWVLPAEFSLPIVISAASLGTRHQPSNATWWQRYWCCGACRESTRRDNQLYRTAGLHRTRNGIMVAELPAEETAQLKLLLGLQRAHQGDFTAIWGRMATSVGA